MPDFKALENDILTNVFRNADDAQEAVNDAFARNEISEAERDALLKIIKDKYKHKPSKPKI